MVVKNEQATSTTGLEQGIETISSRDGTRIAYSRNGQGSPLVLVHGTTADHTRWAPILPALEEHFTVYAVDRRGRAASGDAEDYAVERAYRVQPAEADKRLLKPKPEPPLESVI